MDVKRDHVQKILIITMKTCYRSACDHPFVLGMLLFSFFLYRCVPRLFFFLVSSSPVVICTAVLLGALLSYGNAYLPEIEEQEDEEDDAKISKPHHGISSLRSGGVVNELAFEKDESFFVQSYRDVGVHELKKKNLIFEPEDHQDGDDERSVSDESDGEVELGKVGDDADGDDEKVLIHGVDERKPLIEDENDVAVQYTGIGGEDVEDFGSIQYSAIAKGNDENGESSEYDSDSDRAESSSPDASMADIMPMLDELHPLLDSEHFEPAPVPVDDDVASVDSDVVSESEESSKSSEESEEEAENAEKEEQKGSPDDVTEAVVTWTKEDEKNLMDLGNSELERNRRLENLIARRRSRKNMRMMMTEKNLIDFDGDHLFQMAPISTARRNPFDFHYDSNEGMDLPPIPGSAPSVLAPRRNPFDIPYDPLEERPNLVGGSFEEEVFTSLEKDMHFRRYESFSVGSSSLGQSKQQKPHSKFRPYFVPEQMHSEELGHPTFQRQLSEISESKMSSVTEVESVSSDSDQDDHKPTPHEEQELSQPVHHLERELSQPMLHVNHDLSQSMTPEASHPIATEQTQPMLSSTEYVPDSVLEAGSSSSSSSSSEVDSVESDREYNRDVVADEENAHERDSTSLETTYMLSPVGSETDVVKADIVEEKHAELTSSSSSEVTPVGSETDMVKADIVEEKHAELSSSSSSEVNESPFHVHRNEGLENPKPEPDDASGENFTRPTGENPDIRNAVEEGEDSQIKEPVYDWNWSPSAVEKTLSGITIIEEALSYVDKRGVTSTSSISSDMPVEAVDVVSTPVQVERTISSLDEDSTLNSASIEEATTSGNEGLESVSSHLHGIEENELAPKEVSAVIENDVLDDGFSGDIQNDHTSHSHVAVEDPKDDHLFYENSTSPMESSGSSTQIISEIPPPLSEKQLAHSSSYDDRGNSQEPSSPVPTSLHEGDVIDDSWEVVHEEGDADSSKHSEISEIGPATYEINHGINLHDETQNSRYTEDLMHSNVLETAGEVTDEEEFNVAEEISEIDEDLLTELDAVGDFSIREEEAITYRRENVLVNELEQRPQVLEDYTHGAKDSVEAVDTQVLESRSSGEVQSTVSEMESQSMITPGSEEGSHDVATQLLESSTEEKLDFEEVMTGSVDENRSKDEDTLEFSSSSTTEENVKPDAVGDNILEARQTSTNQSENYSVVDVQESLAELHVQEDNSSEDVGENSNETQNLMGAAANDRDLESSTEAAKVQGKQDLEDNSAKDVEKDFHEIPNLPEALVNHEPRSDEEVHGTDKQLPLDTMEDKLKPSESENESAETEENVSHKSEDSVEVLVQMQGRDSRTEDVYVAAKQPSVVATEDEMPPSEYLDRPGEIEAKGSLKSEDSAELLVHIQDSEPRTEEVHVATEDELRSSETITKSDEIEAKESLKSEDPAEVLVHVQSLEPEKGEVHVATGQLSVDAMKDEQNTSDSVELQGEVHEVTEDELRPSESLNELDEIEAKDSLKSEDPAEVLVHVQSLKPETEGEVHVATRQLSVDGMKDEQNTSDSVESHVEDSPNGAKSDSEGTLTKAAETNAKESNLD